MMDDDCVDDESEQCMVDKTSTTDLGPNVTKIPPTPRVQEHTLPIIVIFVAVVVFVHACMEFVVVKRS